MLPQEIERDWRRAIAYAEDDAERSYLTAIVDNRGTTYRLAAHHGIEVWVRNPARKFDDEKTWSEPVEVYVCTLG